MQTVYFMRHAIPVSSTGWQGDDDLRPLSEEGRVQATNLTFPKVAKVFVSSAKRAQETAVLAGIEGFETFKPLRVRMDDWLLREMKEAAAGVAGDVLFIGHQGSFAQVLETRPGQVVIVRF
jgi:broad specificity phosphatase PhoE